MSDFSNSTLGVTGAAGPFGRTVVETLLARGANKIVAITRTPEKLSDLAAKGVTVRAGDFDDPKSLDAAFAGVDRLLIISTDKLGAPGARLAQHVAAVEAAKRAAVNHIIYTSIPSPYPSKRAQVPDDHYWTEQAIMATGANWTFLRNSLYMDLLVGQLPQLAETGQLIHAAGSGRRNIVSRTDCAVTAAGALLTAEGKSIENVTGREALTLDEIAAIIARSTGKPVAAVAIPGSALIEGMIKHGLPENLAVTFSAFDTDTARGYFALSGDAVERFAGKQPTTLAEFLSGQQLAAAA
jgi:NAD(P)H dehydrogenase (quinone)